jgi:hypothetical protein
MQVELDDPGMTEDDEEIADVDDDDVELDDDSDDEDTVVFSTQKDSDNIGDVSVEINVEELIAEFESLQSSDAARKKEIRRRLEEIREQREAMKELEDTFSFDLNDDD